MAKNLLVLFFVAQLASATDPKSIASAASNDVKKSKFSVENCIDYDGKDKANLAKNAWVAPVERESDGTKQTFYGFTFADGTTQKADLGACTYCYQEIQKIDCKTGLMLTEADIGDCSGGPPPRSQITSLWDGKTVPSQNVEFSNDMNFRLDKIISGKSSKAELYSCKDFAKLKKCQKVWESIVWIGTNAECDVDPECSDHYCGEPHFSSSHEFTIEKVKGTQSICKIQENPLTVKCTDRVKK